MSEFAVRSSYLVDFFFNFFGQNFADERRRNPLRKTRKRFKERQNCYVNSTTTILHDK